MNHLQNFSRVFIVISVLVVIAGLIIELVARQNYQDADNVDQVALLESVKNQELKADVNSRDLNADSNPAAENADSTTSVATEQNSGKINIAPTANAGAGLQTMMVAGGCFWCVESDLEKVTGVSAVVSGYAGGTTTDPTYGDYSSAGHREVVSVVYDPSVVSYSQILLSAIKHMDPTDPNGSFGDRGVEYSPAVYYANSTQQQDAKAVIRRVNKLGVYNKPLTVPVLPATTFYPAEDYHQDFYNKSIVRYKGYRAASGRDTFIQKYWGNQADVIPNTI